MNHQKHSEVKRRSITWKKEIFYDKFIDHPLDTMVLNDLRGQQWVTLPMTSAPTDGINAVETKEITLTTPH